jgi:murein DD-endopeptidase MepM/ murein hydrolase activator NlpD
MSVVLAITGFELKLLQTELLVKKMVSEGINYDIFRELLLTEDVLDKAEEKAANLVKKNADLQKLPYMNAIGYLTFSRMAAPDKQGKLNLVNENTFSHGITRISACEGFQELYGYYKAIISDLKYFPVPQVSDGSADIAYEDSWYQPRTYGGNRKHEGTDLMASNNLRGYFPVISITDGIVEKMGWLEQGGYRIGVRSACGGYFYYAHLDSYSPELEQGDTVIAGQLLGFMGDSGYGSEGTIGKFDVHLHLGIYVNTENGEMSVNPYWILKILEKNRTFYTNGSDDTSKDK